MPAKRLVPLVLAVAILVAACFASAAQAAPARLIGLGVQADRNKLFSFAGDALNTTTVVPVTGLGTASLVGISIRPADGKLYGLGLSANVESLFTIDPASGAATPVGSATPPSGTIAGASSYGIDFNPTADRLRMVDGLASTAGNVNNLRINPASGAIVAVDSQINYAGLSGGEGGSAPLSTIAYDRNVLGAAATTVFGITVGGADRLVRMGGVDGVPSPNGGALTEIGALGVDATANAGLDIDPATGEAYAILQVGGASGLFRINLATGAATSLGLIGGGSTVFGSLAIVPPAPIPPEPEKQPVQPGPESPPPSGPAAAVTLLSLKLSPSAFVAATRGAPIVKAKAKGSAPGTKVSYTLSTPATVSFRVEAPVPGRRGKYKKLKGSFAHRGKAGMNTFRFSGRLGGTTLARGRYRLTATAAAGTRTAGFKILPSSR